MIAISRQLPAVSYRVLGGNLIHFDMLTADS